MWLVLGRSRGQGQRGGQGSAGDSLEPRATELGPLFCNRADGRLEIWEVGDRTSLEAGAELAAQSPSLVRLGRCHHHHCCCHQGAFIKGLLQLGPWKGGN